MEFGELLTVITVLSLALVALCALIQLAIWIYRGITGKVHNRARHWAAGAFVCFALGCIGGVLLLHFTIGKAAFDALFGNGLIGAILWNAALLVLTVGSARLIWSTHDKIRDGAQHDASVE